MPDANRFRIASRNADRYYLADGTEVAAEDVSSYPVPLEQREGVFAHWLKCRRCKVEFWVLSWRRNRPDEVTLRCPECTAVAAVRRTVILNENRNFGSGVEVHNLARLVEERLW
jgi:hypothetical protein